MIEQLQAIRHRQEEILAELSSKAVQEEPARVTALMKEQAELQPIADTYDAYLKGNMSDYIPTDEDLERGFATIPDFGF